MNEFEQLNFYGLANLNTRVPQHVHLFAFEELKAQLIVVPPGTAVGPHLHAAQDEVLDVIAGEGLIQIGDREFRGSFGKSVCIKAGVSHGLVNDAEALWILRSTCRERLGPRDIGMLIRRAIRNRLGLSL